MTERTRQILQEALTLPPEQRTELAQQLLASVDGDDGQANADWVAEVERRARRGLRGEEKAEEWSVVRARLQAKYEK